MDELTSSILTDATYDSMTGVVNLTPENLKERLYGFILSAEEINQITEQLSVIVKNYSISKEETRELIKQNAKIRKIFNEPSKKLPKLLTQPPPVPFNFIGRVDKISEINKKLSHNTPPLLLNGISGIGKTEICSKYFQNNFDKYDYAGWIDYRENLKDSFINQINFDVSSEQMTSDEIFRKIIDTLSNLPNNTLLVIDDIADEKDPELTNLVSLPFNVLCTSGLRIDNFEIVEINSLSEEECKQLFKENCGNTDEDADLCELIKIAGKHTLTVELLAKNAEYSHLALKDLLAFLKENKFNLNTINSGKIKTDLYNVAEEKLLVEHLDNIFEISNINESEKYLLVNLSVLPTVFIEKGKIKQWLKLENYNDINSLVKKGWLTEGYNKIYCHKIIREVVSCRFSPKAKDLEILILSLIEELKIKPRENPLSKKEYVYFGVYVCLKVIDISDKIALLQNTLSAIFMATGKLPEALEFQLKAVETNERLSGKDHPNLGGSYNNISLICRNLGKYEDALKYQQKATIIAEKLFHKEHPYLAESYENLSSIFLELGKTKDALKYQLKAVKINEKIPDKNRSSLASSYSNLTMMYRDLGKLKDALKYQFKNVAIFENNFDKNYLEMAQSYNTLSSIYWDLGKLKDALEFQLKVVEIYERILYKDHPELAAAYNNLSSLYCESGKMDEAYDFQLKAIEIREKVLDKNHPDLGHSYLTFAKLYYKLKNKNKAKEYIEMSLVIYKKSLPANHPTTENTISWLEEINRM